MNRVGFRFIVLAFFVLVFLACWQVWELDKGLQGRVYTVEERLWMLEER